MALANSINSGTIAAQNANNVAITGGTWDSGTMGISTPVNEGTFLEVTIKTTLALENGSVITTDFTTGHAASIQAYSTDAGNHITLGTLTNGASATFALNAPTNGSLTIDNAVIGNITPNTGIFTILEGSAVDLTGGFINGVTIGNVTPAFGGFTYIQTSLLTNSTSSSTYIVDVVADAYYTLNTLNAGGTDISLPAVSTAPDGFTWGVSNLSTGVTNIHAAGGDNINGAALAALEHYQTITLQKSRVANTWIILNEARSNASGLSPASTIKIVDDTTTNADFYPAFVGGTSGQQAEYVSSTKLTYHPSTGALSSTRFLASGFVSSDILQPFTTNGQLSILNQGSSVAGNSILIQSTNGGIALISGSNLLSINSGAVFQTGGAATFPSITTPGVLGLITSVSGTTQTIVVGTWYTNTSGSLCTYTLPTTAAVGDVFSISGQGAGGWKIAQNASQLIHLGSSVTTTGTGGSLASTNSFDSITLRCVVANTTWTTQGAPQGNITVI